MSAPVAVALVVIVGVGTYLLRAGAILALADRTLPVSVERALRNVGPAVLSALVVNLLAGTDGVGGIEGPELVAAAVVVVVAWWRRSVPLALGVGMVALWVTLALG